MPAPHIRTFLANASRDPVELVRRYGAYGKGGGYNYWRTSESAVRDLTLGGKSYDEAVGRCTAIAKPDERLANARAVKTFYDWQVGRKLHWIEPPMATYVGPRGLLRVKVKADAAWVGNGTGEVILIWPYDKPPLRQKIAGLGVHMMRKAFEPLGYRNFDFVIHDVSGEGERVRRFKSGSEPEESERLLDFILDSHERAYELTHPDVSPKTPEDTQGETNLALLMAEAG